MRRSGFTKIELAIVSAVWLILLAVLIPAIQHARENARRNMCIHSMKEWGLAFQNHQDAHNYLPPSCNDAGWSWCILLEPFYSPCGLWDFYATHSLSPLQEPKGDKQGNHAKILARNMFDSLFLCPSFQGTPHIDMTTKAEAITNYKALGGTHMESLNVASANPTVPRYGGVKNHPDGAIFPGSKHGLDDFTDGTSCTFVLTETIEQNVARWVVGNETCLVGLPPVVQFSDPTDEMPYYHPTGFTANKFWSDSTVSADSNWTYLNWDYDSQPYDDGGISTPSKAASGPIKYGPSSHHKAVTNHLFADGSVKSIRNEIDAAAYMFLITRKGGDPSGPTEE
jgi:hypothetical protein